MKKIWTKKSIIAALKDSSKKITYLGKRIYFFQSYENPRYDSFFMKNDYGDIQIVYSEDVRFDKIKIFQLQELEPN